MPNAKITFILFVLAMMKQNNRRNQKRKKRKIGQSKFVTFSSLLAGSSLKCFSCNFYLCKY